MLIALTRLDQQQLVCVCEEMNAFVIRWRRNVWVAAVTSMEA